MSNKPSDRILSFQIKRAIQAEALHAAQKEIELLKSKPELTDAQILELWEQTYVQRGTSGIEFARCVLALAAGAAPAVPPGYALVPLEPTQDMLWASESIALKSLVDAVKSKSKSKTFSTREGLAELTITRYRAMIAAAPKEPQK